MVKELQTDQGVLYFDDDGHTYTLEGKKLKSTSDITGVLDKSNPLMAWAVNQCASSMRDQLEPDTEYSQSEIEDMIKTAKGARWRSSQEALNIGSQLHSWVEDHIKDKIDGGDGLEDDLPDREPVLEAAVEFLSWEDEHVYKWLSSEEIVLIPTEAQPVGGTYDAMAETDQGLLVVDFKTSKAVYESHVLQLAGYYHGATQTLGYDPDGLCVLRCPKDESEVESWIETDSEEISRHVKGFLRAAGLYFWKDNLDI